MIKWEIFSARVPAGTMATSEYGVMGVILETYCHFMDEASSDMRAYAESQNDEEIYNRVMRNHRHEDSEWCRFEPFRVSNAYATTSIRGALNIEKAQYLIDGMWRTYAQVMGDEA